MSLLKIATIEVFTNPDTGDISATSSISMTENQDIHDTVMSAADALVIELHDMQG